MKKRYRNINFFRFLWSFLFVTISSISFSQELVNFQLNSNGNFTLENGDNYVVVPFEGKDSSEIYQMLLLNTYTIYNDPSKVLSTIENSAIKIRGYSDVLYLQKVLGKDMGLPAYYQLEFLIKDGRVRVSAPYVEDTATLETSLGDNEGAYRRIVKKWFKNDIPKEKEITKIKYTENQLNNIINTILGFCGTPTLLDEDW